ncbi:response regulator [bacterium]|nr:response regulator [bacterium]
MNQLEKVLIVDDDKQNLEIISYMLNDQYSMKTALNGEEALKIAKEFHPGIVLLDIMMPGIDGYEVCKRMREYKGLTGTKILLVSAKVLVEDRLKGYEVGADDYIQKPFNEEELFSKVKVFTRLNAEEKKSRQLNRLLLSRQQDIPNMLWECDTDLCFVFVDDSVRNMLGYSPEEMLGKPIVEFLANGKKEFEFKFQKQISQQKPQIHGIYFTFRKKSGDPITLQVYADGVYDDNLTLSGMGGIFRDMYAFSNLISYESSDNEEMTIRLDENYRLIYMAESVENLVDIAAIRKTEDADLTHWLCDPDSKNLISFAFTQQEDVPFPIEFELPDLNNSTKRYSVDLHYIINGPYIEGKLVPVSADGQLGLASNRMKNQQEKIREQEETLKNAVIIDVDTQNSIVKDAGNLAAEILVLIKALETFAYPDDNDLFNLEAYTQFVHNRNLQVYSENLRLMGNKIHGLKGNCGFLIPEAKQLCHKMEDLVRPVSELKLVLTRSITKQLKGFVFKIEDMLEQFQQGNLMEFDIADWLENIDTVLADSLFFIGNKAHEFSQFVAQRNTDKGDVRKNRGDEYLSVTLDGYESLAEKVKDLYFMFSSALGEEQRVQAGNLFNQFLSTHQQIKKVPLNLTRYERLVPKLAKDYDKEADFQLNDHQVKADREFWDAVHEILNHMIKNAVIHGLETPEERKKQGKEPVGKIVVDLKEDAIHIRLSISDDGRGINTQKIADKAVERGIVTRDQLSAMSEKEILDMLFVQGVSTADSLDDNAGRGVGMNAVIEAIHQFQGEYEIDNRPGEGCSWNLSFMKNNVSLACIIVAIGDFSLAIPEDFIETFLDFNEQKVLTIKQSPAYPYNGKPVPLIDSETLFNSRITGAGKKQRSLVILNDKKEQRGIVISQILHHAIQPILPLPKIFRDIPIYQGITFFKNQPVQVVNVANLF